MLLADNHKFWILDPLYNAMGWILAQAYSVLPSFGLAIIVLTMVMSLVRSPLVAKQVRNQKEMQKVQPEVKRIQAKYKNDPQKRNEAMMRVYKENNVNPLAGCLPMLLQMPLFITLYRLIIDLNAKPDPKHLPRTSELFAVLQETGGAMKSFGMDLAVQASRVSGFGPRLPYFLLIGLVVGTGFFQQRQMMRRMPENAATQQMRVVGKVLPIVFGVFSYSIPAGVVLYFIVSNSFQIAQQWWLYRDTPDAIPPPKTSGKPAPKKPTQPQPHSDRKAIPTTEAPPPESLNGAAPAPTPAKKARKSANPTNPTNRPRPPVAKPRPTGSRSNSSSRSSAGSKSGAGSRNRVPPKKGLLARLIGSGPKDGSRPRRPAKGSTSRPKPGGNRSSGTNRPGTGRVTPPGTPPRSSPNPRKGGRGGSRRET